MATKTYISTVNRRPPRPRNRRLRECGYYTQSTTSATTTATATAAEVTALRETIRELTAQVETLSSQVRAYGMNTAENGG